jgi:hypothetical protein
MRASTFSSRRSRSALTPRQCSERMVHGRIQLGGCIDGITSAHATIKSRVRPKTWKIQSGGVAVLVMNFQHITVGRTGGLPQGDCTVDNINSVAVVAKRANSFAHRRCQQVDDHRPKRVVLRSLRDWRQSKHNDVGQLGRPQSRYRPQIELRPNELNQHQGGTRLQPPRLPVVALHGASPSVRRRHALRSTPDGAR